MSEDAEVIAPAQRSYRGSITDPARWSSWTPRRSDILVCTPPKCGTTWTQTILAMLVNGGPDLPQKLPFLSPWVDADLNIPMEEVTRALSVQTGRRVVKTHTPADGFPLWDGVTIIAVYRHPLDVFFSLRKHIQNTRKMDPSHPMNTPVPQAIRAFLGGPIDRDDFDRDTLANLSMHYAETVLSGRIPQLKLLHYADMKRDPRATVRRLAEMAGIDASAGLLEAVAKASDFIVMKKNAADYAPVGGTGYWKSDAGFFDSASSDKWQGQLTGEELRLYQARLADLIPDARARAWLEGGDAGASTG